MCIHKIETVTSSNNYVVGILNKKNFRQTPCLMLIAGKENQLKNSSSHGISLHSNLCTIHEEIKRFFYYMFV